MIQKLPDKNRTALNTAGLRVTAQRALILKIIGLEQGHLDADEIYRLARVRQPGLSLSTVYRTLRMLKEQGLVDELHFDENHHHYEARPPREHHHLVCLACGQIIEFNYPLAGFLRKNVNEARDFEIVDTQISMTGYCARCSRDME